MFGEIATKWTIRLALLCYTAYLAGALTGRNGRLSRAARWLWTIGCGLFLAHVACAFHFYHGWSHAAALESTARETQELLGVRFGEGIYFSYLFAAVWVFDVVRLWLSPGVSGSGSPFEGGRIRLWVHVYLLFIAINGAMVFEAGPTRWAGALACVLLMGMLAARAYNARKDQSDAGDARATSPSRKPQSAAAYESTNRLA